MDHIAPAKPMKKYCSDVAIKFADTRACIEDLKRASLQFELAAIKTQNGGIEYEILAHWMSGMTLYGRVFKGGVRKADSMNIVSGLKSDMRSFHDWLINMRDKHIAHSVNTHEDAVPVVQRNNGITDVDCWTVSFLYPDEKDLRQCARIAGEISDMFQKIADGLRNEFLEEAKALPDEIIAGLPEAKFTVPGPAGATAIRQRTQNR